MSSCASCGSGTVLADGYCDTCGAKAASATATPAPVVAAPMSPAPAGPPRTAGSRCAQPGCTGTVLADGYCDTCGTKAVPPSASAGPAPTPTAEPATGLDRSTSAALASRPRSFAVASTGSRRTTSARTSSRSQRSGIGAGVVTVPPAPTVDPTTIVMADPEVSEDKRFCGSCGAPVGRAKGDRPGRTTGFCGQCRQAFDFVPKLSAGDRVGGQYEVVGAIAHGGLGWIYLVRDKAVNDRWCVLKGLLNTGDEAAMAAAVLERQFLAEVQHPSIVEIYNFVSHQGAGYTVMEYVGGPSLKQLLKQRREANGGRPDPLAVEVAIAYVLGVLPAFSYLHERGLLYCDFKPDNIIQVRDDVKLIDLGGVRRADATTGDIYGTVGFQAPEIAEMGPSISSDVYTIGRTLTVLSLDFAGYQGRFEHSLPEPADHPALAGHESFHRLLLKATAAHPDDRFTSVAELGDQLLGVLREVVAITTGRPQPGPSVAFGAVPLDGGLPALRVEPGDPAAAFLADLPTDDPAAALSAIEDAVSAGQVPETLEVRLRRARALLDHGDRVAAVAEADRVEVDDPWEWRAVWLRGVAALAVGDGAGVDLATAEAAFDRCMTEVPGELAPKLAAATVAERAGAHAVAESRYGVVAAVDPAVVAAAAGLARCRLAAGDATGALAAYDLVPRSHRAWVDTQLDAARALVGAGRFTAAAGVVDRLELDPARVAELDIELFEAALSSVAAPGATSDPTTTLRGVPVDEPSLRTGLEAAYRALADRTPDRDERYRLVDRANAVRPRSLV